MRIRSRKIFSTRTGAIRFMALAAVLLVTIAATHETLLALERATLQAHCTPEHNPSTPAPAHHQDERCPLCKLAGAPTLLSLDAELPAPLANIQVINVALHLTPAVRDTSCFPHLRRAPPILPLV